jgi:hypothetical protein
LQPAALRIVQVGASQGPQSELGFTSHVWVTFG